MGLFLLLFSLFARAEIPAWNVTQPAWTPAHEDKFSEFIALLGQSKCRSLNACLTSPDSNPLYANRTPKNIRYFSDCADLPYSLRAYFSWMEGLPFDYVSAVTMASSRDAGRDIRYTSRGNKPAAWRKFTFGKRYNVARELEILRDSVSTATYRMHYSFVSDFYPVAINPAFIRPGTVVYDASGHAAIVFKVESDGRVRMMDAHPDQSITRITYDKKFGRSRPEHGAGFKNWRPELDTRPSADLPGFSTEQFQARFVIDGRAVNYYDYVRTLLAGGHLKYEPVTELKSMLGELCVNLQDRVNAVSAAARAGIDEKNHPATLPDNIYGTSGEWEEYSTPSRDARLKVAFLELRQTIADYVEQYRLGNPRIEYQPVDSRYSAGCASDRNCLLAASLLSAYEEVSASPACRITYVNSEGRGVELPYPEMVKRLFRLSFDPYHCVELRWGADTAELGSCRDSREKFEWYEAEQNLRNQLERTYDAFMGYDRTKVKRLGAPTAPDVDLAKYLRGLLRL